MPHAEVSGRLLHYLERGAGEPLLLIQGMSGTHASWGEAFLSELAPDFACVSYDHRGMGYSGRVSDPFSLADLADDAAGLLDALGVQSAHVLGISLGGMVAQHLVLRHPERLRTLALGCTYCGGPRATVMDPSVAAGLGKAVQAQDVERVLRLGWELNLSPGFRADESLYPAFREMSLAAPAPARVTLLQAQAAMVHDTSARLHEIAAPTLVIHGTVDRMIDAANGRLIASLIPGARLELLDGVGHLFWWEQPERSAALLREHALVSQGRQ